jgi:hypothetical protein
MIKIIGTMAVASIVASLLVCVVLFKPLYKIYGDTRPLGYRYGSHIMSFEAEEEMERKILFKRLLLTHLASAVLATLAYAAFRSRLANPSLKPTPPHTGGAA